MLEELNKARAAMIRTITRRQMSKMLLTAGTGTLALGLYTWRVEPHWLGFTHSFLPVTGLPSELEGRTLAQISDLIRCLPAARFSRNWTQVRGGTRCSQQ